MPWPSRMFLVRWLQAARNTSGADEWLYSSRKWCSTSQTYWMPSESASSTCSSASWISVTHHRPPTAGPSGARRRSRTSPGRCKHHARNAAVARLRVITWNSTVRPGPASTRWPNSCGPTNRTLSRSKRSARPGEADLYLLGWPRPAWAFKHNGYWPLWWRAEGLAVLSHYSWRCTRPCCSPRGQPAELPSGGSSCRLSCVLEEEELRVLLVDAHLSSGAADEDRRTEQAGTSALLPDASRSSSGRRPQRHPSRPPSESAGSGPRGRLDVGRDGIGATIPANAPRRRIDYVMVRGGLGVTGGPPSSTISARR